MDLRQRLALLRQLQSESKARQAAAETSQQPADRGKTAPISPLANPVAAPASAPVGALPAGVAEHETPHGPVWWREQFYPASYSYGRQPLAAFPDISPHALALIARDARLQSVQPHKLVLLDTETTGLSGGTGTVPFLIGIGQWQDGGLLIRQYFLPDYGYEQPMLAHLAATLGNGAGLISFNGKSFDQPLLATRFIMQRQRLPLADEPHVDLLHPARRLWRRRLGDCRLTNLECHVLAKHRDDDVPGHLIPALYTDYLFSRRPESLNGVIAHNELDLLALAGLAVQLATALDGDHRPPLHPLDELSRGIWLEDLGETAAAVDAYRAALAAGLDGPGRHEALWRLGIAQRRLGQYADAAATWTELAASGNSVAALVELAKYHEHRTGDLAVALSLTEQAIGLALERRWLGMDGRGSGAARTELDALRHRQARLQRKLARKSAASPQSLDGAS